jgi:serine/threonine protein kinase
MVTQNQSKVPDGTLLEGKFRVTREIGRGGMAAVYEAENVDIGKRVAVKILAAELITSRIVRERFLREARAAAAVRSPYICDVYDSGMYEERPFLVMELLEGESLYDLLTRARQLDFDNTLRIATHSARGLGKAHESNIVHRDLKPENIFLTKDEEGLLLAKLVDFGLAKFYEPMGPDQATVRLTREGALFGTPAYMSPEQAKGKGEVDHRADLWALGCIVYECLTGQTVWSVDQGVAMILAQIASAPLPRPSKLRPDLPPAFEHWFQRALDRDPDKRFQTARELADALTKALTQTAPQARSLSLSSDHEGGAVDELMATGDKSPRLADGTSDSVQPATVRTPEAGGLPVGSSAAPGAQASVSEASSGRAISILMFVALVCLGGYAAWLYVLHPPSKSGVAAAGGPKTGPSGGSNKPGKSAGKSGDAPESETYAKLLFEAQDLLTNGSAKDALERFKAAFQAGSQPQARSLLSQATVVVEEGSGACRVNALARPRPFTIVEPSGRPTLVKTDRGILFAWVDTHVDAKRRQAHAVLLDGAMRRVSEPIPVTPESSSVRTLQLLRSASGAALSYWEDTGDGAGVYVRRLDSDGKIAGPARRVSELRRGELHPTLISSEAGGFWSIWEEDAPRGHVDVMARRLDDKLEPQGKAVRLAEVASAPRNANTASSPDAVVAQGALQVVFSVDRGADRHQIMLLRVPLNEPGLATGVVLDKKKKAPVDLNLGTLSPLSRASSKNTTPRIACVKEACAVVWDDDNAGAYAAYVERDKAEPLWHREFSAKGIRPTLASSGEKTLVAWYEDSRLKLAELGRDGLGKVSVLSRVNGFQPEADIAHGEKPGEWLIAWRDYESAHFEAFGLRTECQ